MQSDTEDTPAQPYGPEFVLTTAMHDLMGLFDTKDREAQEFLIQKNAVLLKEAGVWEPLIQTYCLLGERLSMACLNLQELKVLRQLFKRQVFASKKRADALTRPTPAVKGRRGGWSMSVPEWRTLWRTAKQELGPTATFQAMAEKIGMHVTTVRLYRKRDEVYDRLLQEWGREPTEAEVDAVVSPNHQKRRSTHAR